jgi:hypothetical protein
MSEGHIRGEAKDKRIERLKRRARSMDSIAASGSLRDAWIFPLVDQA